MFTPSTSIRDTRNVNLWTGEQVRRYRGTVVIMANRLMGSLQAYVPADVLNANPLMSDTWSLCQAVVTLNHATETVDDRAEKFTEKRAEKDRQVYLKKITDLENDQESLKKQFKWGLIVFTMMTRHDVAGICTEICR